MFKDHPKGLFVAFFANMGERFGFYTMMAILILFLQAKYNLSAEAASGYYSWFYYAIYALALFGGVLADSTSKYKLVILFGIIIMFVGYGVIAIPGMPLHITVVGLFVIAFGNGLFKGNLQAVVGQLYDDPKYSKFRDTAFMIFYMGINVGAFFAPFAANAIRNWFLRTQGFAHDGSLPAMCHAFLDGRMTDSASIASLESLASKVSSLTVTGADALRTFAAKYIAAFSQGYNYAFGLAAIAMIISLLVYIIFNKHLPAKAKRVAEKSDKETGYQQIANLPSIVTGAVFIAITAAVFHFAFNQFALGMAMGLFFGFVAFIFKTSTHEEKPRVVALVLVFFVVIFFWMSFHQNGLTQTFFARDYTVKEVGPINNIFFNLNSMLAFIGCVAGLFLLITKKKIAQRTIGLAMFAGLGALTYYFVSGYKAMNPIEPEIFQSFNPLFIVVLTFPVMAIFAWLRKKNIEPSTPRKIGIGMVIAAVGFVIMLVGSLQLVAPKLIASANMTEWGRVSPSWLISSYLTLTIAELFLSPMGLSFVSKVSPLRFQGLMQGGWLLATATGNKLLFIGGYFWDKIELWQIWGIFVICCLLSAAFIFSIMKRLERTTKS
ncbi:MAG: MFS transporter [Acidobacteria bacterium]|nr:MFS transporter [Acidobacteriota bacterium]MBU4404438.1 MFS transporter [Acidobacteriota bacterium]MCG2811374.1 MFS transporter [Candidatus Aminicenantes bacterium]